MNVQPLLIETSPSSNIRLLAFNRPRKRNALSQNLIRELLSAFRNAANDANVRAIVVTGTKDFFSAGADIGEISALNAASATESRYLADLVEGMKAVRKPLIAAVEGMALGGGFEVAMMCDIIVASKTASFGLPEVKIGLLPGAGGTQRLTAAVGKYRAMRMILSGAPILGVEAERIGLVSECCEPGSAVEKAIELAGILTVNSPQAVSLAKQAILRADGLARDEEFERSLYYYAFGTKDKEEGVKAFLEKRKPEWA